MELSRMASCEAPASPGSMVFGNLRRRTCIVRDNEGESTYEFDFQKRIWMRIKRLPPLFWRTESGIVPVAVFHGGKEVDGGHLEIDCEEQKIIPRGFDSCFLQIRDEAVRALAAGHLCFNDRLSFMVDNGAYRRMGLLSGNPLYGISYLAPTYRFH